LNDGALSLPDPTGIAQCRVRARDDRWSRRADASGL